MFGFIADSMSGGEIMIILLALLLLFGSKNLPSIARNLGKSMESFRKATRDVTDEIMRADVGEEPPAVKRPAASISAPAAEAKPAEPSEEPELTVTPSTHAVERNGNERT